MIKNRGKIINKLKDFHLSDKEISLYLAVLANGPTTATNLAKASNLKRPTVYVLLEGLEEKGLVEVNVIKGRQFFKVSTLDKFKDLIEEELLKIEKQRRMVDGLIDELSTFKQAGKEPVSTTYHEGEEGIFNIFEQIIASGQEPEFFGSTKELSKKYGREKWFRVFTKAKDEKSEARVMTNKSSLAKENMKNIKILPEDFESKAIMVAFGEKISLMTLGKYPFGIVIENKEITKLIKFMLQFSWNKI